MTDQQHDVIRLLVSVMIMSRCGAKYMYKLSSSSCRCRVFAWNFTLEAAAAYMIALSHKTTARKIEQLQPEINVTNCKRTLNA